MNCWFSGQIRKRDWNEQGVLLKARINRKLSAYQAAAKLQIKSIVVLDSDGKFTKRLVHEAVALLIDAAEACLLSVWRKLRSCEELFDSLLAGVAQVSVARGGQPLRVLLIHLKPIALAVCAQVYSMVVLFCILFTCNMVIFSLFIRIVFCTM